MTPEKVLKYCAQCGGRLWVEGGKLRYDIPKIAVTMPLLQLLREHKTNLIALLTEPTETPENLFAVCCFPIGKNSKQQTATDTSKTDTPTAKADDGRTLLMPYGALIRAAHAGLLPSPQDKPDTWPDDLNAYVCRLAAAVWYDVVAGEVRSVYVENLRRLSDWFMPTLVAAVWERWPILAAALAEGNIPTVPCRLGRDGEGHLWVTADLRQYAGTAWNAYLRGIPAEPEAVAAFRMDVTQEAVAALVSAEGWQQ